MSDTAPGVDTWTSGPGTWSRFRGGRVAPIAALACAICCLAIYAVLFANGWTAVGRVGDDGIRVRPVSRTGLVVTAILPGSAAAGQDLAVGNAIDGVDNLVTRDERALLRAFASRPAGRESRLHVQYITPGGSTGAGMGSTQVVTVRPRPRLSTPAVSIGLRIVGLAGVAALVAATIAALGFRADRAAWWTLIAAGAFAGLVLARLFAEAGYATSLIAPPLVAVLVASAAFLLASTRHRGLLVAATGAAALGGAVTLVVLAVPLPSLDPRHTAVAADIGLATLALIPLASAAVDPQRDAGLMRSLRLD